MRDLREMCRYALMSALRNEGLDDLDVLSVFVLKVISEEVPIGVEEIQNQLTTNLGFRSKIPAYVLNSIIKRAKRRSYIEASRQQRTDQSTGEQREVTLFRLTSKGASRVNELDRANVIQERIQELIKSIRIYLTNEKGLDLKEKAINDMLLGCMRKNIATLAQFIHKDASIVDHVVPGSPKYERYLLDYVRFAKSNIPAYHETLRLMFYGSIISVIFFTKESQFPDITTRKMRSHRVYLDTNFAFSLLDMHNPEQSAAAKYLFSLLNKQKCEVKIFDFTIYEMRRVMFGYPHYLQIKEKGQLPRIEGTSLGLYGSLANKEWRERKASEFIDDVEHALESKGIRIDRIPKSKLVKYETADEDARRILERKKPTQSMLSRNHDLAAIEIVKQQRQQPIHKVEDSKVFFLTSDKILSRANYEDMHHKEKDTVCEVILDTLLSHISWLKDPGLQVPLETIIAAHERDLFVNERVWTAFFEKLKDLVLRGEIGEDNIIVLFFNNYIEDVLADITEEEIDDTINDEFVRQHLKDAERRAKAMERHRLKAMSDARQKYTQVKGKLDETASRIENIQFVVSAYLAEKEAELDESVRVLSASQMKRIIRIVFGVNVSLLLALIIAYLLSGKHWLIGGIVPLLLTAILKLGNKWPWEAIKKTTYNIVFKNNKGHINIHIDRINIWDVSSGDHDYVG